MQINANDNANAPSVIIDKEDPAYAHAIKTAFPDSNIIESTFSSSFANFDEGKNVLLYESAGLELANNHPDYTFTPHYIKTVIIAIDRDQTKEKISGWNDLLQSNHLINFSFGNDVGHNVWNTSQNYHIVTAMAKALYGSYDIKAIAQDFRKIYTEGRFITNDSSLAISVMHDSEAVELIKQGRNIEIIFPIEGTLGFVCGILHNTDIECSKESLNELLIENGFRLTDGRASNAYPPSNMYGAVEVVQDYSKYNKAIATIDSIMRRDSFDTQRYGFANRKERIYAYIICIVIVIAYLISILFRVTHEYIKKALTVICSLELLLATTQFIKSMVGGMPILETVLWYAFYFSFVLIPVTFVYVSIVTGTQPEKKKLPLLFKIYFCLSWLPIIFVATNNLHEQVFDIYDYVHTYFYYKWGYYVVMAWIYLSLLFAIGNVMRKSFQNPRRWAFVLPLLVSILTVLYTIGVVLRIPIARDFEVGYGTAIALLLFIEASIQSRLFPINKGYSRLFSKSNLKMEIRDKNYTLILQSTKTDNENKNYVLHRNLIPGGYFLFYEDYTTLNETKEKRAIKNAQLKKNNILLQENSSIEADLATLSVQKEVYKNIDTVLNRDSQKISTLLHSMNDTKNNKKNAAKIIIMACGIKRESIIRVNSLYKNTISANDFLLYMNEMGEFTENVNLKITIASSIEKDLPLKQVLVMYEVFRSFLDKAIDAHCNNVLAQLYENDQHIVFSLIANYDISQNIDIQLLNKKAKALHGSFISKPWDDTCSFLLSFKKEENL